MTQRLATAGRQGFQHSMQTFASSPKDSASNVSSLKTGHQDDLAGGARLHDRFMRLRAPRLSGNSRATTGFSVPFAKPAPSAA